MTRNLTDAELRQIVDELVGTAGPDPYELAVEKFKRSLSVADCEIFDTMIFRCEGCGWWCDHDEMTSNVDKDWHCTDCAPNDSD